jgi:hypothetical protein
MTATAIIGAKSPMGSYWASKRYFDCLVDDDNLSVFKGQTWAEVVLIDPILQVGPNAEGVTAENDAERVTCLINALQDTKIERLTIVTTTDTIPYDGDEASEELTESSDPFVANRIRLLQALRLQFGRVFVAHLPELLGAGLGYSPVLDALARHKAKKTMPVRLLERHQFYPMHRVIDDVEKAWACGLSKAIWVSEPMTSFEITEKIAPELQDDLPIAHEQDPIGSKRQSNKSYYWYDPMCGYILEKDALIELLKEQLPLLKDETEA